jgi:hypothetical protein
MPLSPEHGSKETCGLTMVFVSSLKPENGGFIFKNGNNCKRIICVAKNAFHQKFGRHVVRTRPSKITKEKKEAMINFENEQEELARIALTKEKFPQRKPEKAHQNEVVFT